MPRVSVRLENKATQLEASLLSPKMKSDWSHFALNFANEPEQLGG